MYASRCTMVRIMSDELSADRSPPARYSAWSVDDYQRLPLPTTTNELTCHPERSRRIRCSPKSKPATQENSPVPFSTREAACSRRTPLAGLEHSAVRGSFDFVDRKSTRLNSSHRCI